MKREHDPVLEQVKLQLPRPPDAFLRLRERREARARRKRATAGVVGLSVTAVLVAGVVWSVAGGGSEENPDLAGAAVPLVAGQGEYYYVSFSWDDDAAVESWLAPDGTGRRVWDRPEDPVEEVVSAKEGSEWLLPELSTDPDEVLQQLIQRSGPAGDSPVPIATTSPGRSQETTSVLRSISDLLTYGSGSFLTPEQISAVFGAAQRVDGVTTEADVVDPWGRPAVRLTHVIDYNYGEGSDVRWYFDPVTGQFLGEVWVDRQTGKVQRATQIEFAGIAISVDSVPERDARYVVRGEAEPSFPNPQDDAGPAVVPSPEAT